MKKIIRGILGLVLCGGMGAVAEDLVIDSLEGAGQLSFTHVTNAASYRVEWAPSPGGPWTNSWNALSYIPAPADGSVTCSVAMCYRVVAEMGIPMVQIPAGTNAGTDPDFGDYSLTVETFYMATTETTKSQWDNVYIWAIANGYTFDNPGLGTSENYPVHTVNSYDCVKWCNARSEREGLTPCYTISNNVYKVGQSRPDCNFNANGYRLPTEDEWEYAGRGGGIGQRFPWGNTITHAQATYYSDARYAYDISPTRRWHPSYGDGAAPVGSFSPNTYELYDMVGNVSEWFWHEGESNSKGGSSYSTVRTVRLGAFYAPGGVNAITATTSIGFRIVRR